jgi:hypothetical protein
MMDYFWGMEGIDLENKSYYPVAIFLTRKEARYHTKISNRISLLKHGYKQYRVKKIF